MSLCVCAGAGAGGRACVLACVRARQSFILLRDLVFVKCLACGSCGLRIADPGAAGLANGAAGRLLLICLRSLGQLTRALGSPDLGMGQN